jgi:hypothetical protein
MTPFESMFRMVRAFANVKIAPLEEGTASGDTKSALSFALLTINRD